MSQDYKIVCVDDNEDVLSLYQEFLSNFHHEVIIFSKSDEAADYIKENHRSIIFIFSDFQMPVLDGFQLREKIVAFASMVPYAIVTGFYDKEMATRAMELNICSFVEN